MRVAIAILIIMLCACRTETKLSDDKGIQDIFSPSEIADLEKVLTDFDTLVLEVTHSSDIESGYKKLSEELVYGSETTDWKLIDREIILFAQQTVNELKDKSVFDGLWYLSGVQSYQPPDSMIEALPRTFDSKYLTFLEHCIKEDNHLEPYKESIQWGGSVGPSLFAGFPQGIKELNVKKDCIRLFIAIHFINARNQQHYNKEFCGTDIRFPKFKPLDKSKGLFDQLIEEPTEVEE
jgi:hypothetical protein